MFYKKKVQKEAEKAATGFLQSLEEIHQCVDALAAISDVAERYEACVDAEKKIARLEHDMTAYRKTLEVKGSILAQHVAGWSAALTVAGAMGAAAIFLATFPVSMIVAFTGLMGTLLGGAFVGDTAQEAVVARNAEILHQALGAFQADMQGMYARVAAHKTQILNTSMQQMAACVRFNEMHARYPEVRAAFELEARKKQLLGDEPIRLSKPAVKKPNAE